MARWTPLQFGVVQPRDRRKSLSIDLRDFALEKIQHAIVTEFGIFLQVVQSVLLRAEAIHQVKGGFSRVLFAPQLQDLARNEIQKCVVRSEEHTSELQSLAYLVCRLLLE